MELQSERIGVAFSDALVIERLVHHPTGTIVASDAEQMLLIRLPGRISDPVFLYDAEILRVDDHLVIGAIDETYKFFAKITLTPSESGLRFQLEVKSPEPIWMVEWRLVGLNLEEVIVPALGGQAIGRKAPAERDIVYKYPFWWNAQFALLSINQNDGLWLRAVETEPRLKTLIVRKLDEETNRFAIGLGFEADAPLVNGKLTAEWFLDGYSGNWRVPVDIHRKWMENAFRLKPSYLSHPHYPAWMSRFNMVLEIWGMRKSLGRPGHTFDEIIKRVDEFAALHPPEQTLLYLPGFAGSGIDSEIPDYTPSPGLGGADGLRRLISRAHNLGYRVMLHTNVLGMTFTHPRFREFEAYQVIDPFGRPQGWGNDIDGDWLIEPYFAYINPGYSAWGDLMESVIGGLIEEFGPDAIFLDQTLLAFNDQRGPNFVKGMRRHIVRLQKAFPDTLFAGEGIHEHVLSALPVVQIHGLDSITDVHGPEGQPGWRYVHPVSAYLFGKHTRFLAHLLTKHPSHSFFPFQERAYSQLDVVPALVLYHHDQPIDGPSVRRMIERAKSLTPLTFSN